MLVYASEVFIIYTYISDVFTRKFKPFTTNIIGCLLFIPPYICNELWNNVPLNCALFFITTMIFILITYNIKFLESILHSLLISCIMLSTEVLCFYSVSAIFEQSSYYAYRDSAEVYIYDAIISKILFLLVCKICSNFKIKNNNKTYRAPISYYVYTISSFSLILCLVFINGQYKFNSSFQLFIVASATFLLFSLIFIFISYEKSARKNAEIVELKTETQKQKLDEKYYQILQSQNENMHTFAHDTKHHLSMIKNLSEDEAIHQYINSIYKDIEKYSVVGKTQNKTLDIILNEYQTLCDIKNIEFETDIKTANLNYIEPTKLTSLLTNILDNAIEATEKCNNKKIMLSINNIDNFDVLTCINSCINKPEITDVHIKTTKSDVEFHGYGTKSIAKTVKLYNGTLRYEFNQIKKAFVLTIIFPKQ